MTNFLSIMVKMPEICLCILLPSLGFKVALLGQVHHLQRLPDHVKPLKISELSPVRFGELYEYYGELLQLVSEEVVHDSYVSAIK